MKLRPPSYRSAYIAAAVVSVVSTMGSTKPAYATFDLHGCANASFCTLQELQAPSAFIEIDDVKFKNFSELFVPTNLIKVTPIDSPGSALLSVVGLKFEPIDPNNNPWFSEADAFGHSSIGGTIFYDIEVLHGIKIGGANLVTQFILDVSNGFFDSLGATETIDRPSPHLPRTLTVSCTDFALGECDGKTDFKNTVFGSESLLGVTNDIFGSATQIFGGEPDNIGISFLTNEFIRVPEPGALALFAAGVVALNSIRRRRNRVVTRPCL